MTKKQLRVGKTVFIVNSVLRDVCKAKITKLEVVELFSERGVPFAETDQTDCRQTFSLRDYNIIPNNYNRHRVFFTPTAAYNYARKLKGSSNGDRNHSASLPFFMAGPDEWRHTND